MHSTKTSKELPRKMRVYQKSAGESNEIEEVSSRSPTGDSGDRSQRSIKTERLSSHSSKRGKRTEDETEDYLSDVKHRKEKQKKKKTSRSVSRESLDGEISGEADVFGQKEYIPIKKHRKSRRKDEDESHESNSEKVSSSKRSSEKNKKKKHQEQGKLDELPITEILKKAQDHHRKYEEPTPMPELTTNTIYVQGRNGFNAMKIARMGKQSGRDSGAPHSMSSRPIKVAVAFQKIWLSGGFIFQGLFAGMALLHLIFMRTYYHNTEEFVEGYSTLSEIYSSVFSFLIAMCIISTFDKFDVAHISGEHLHEIFKRHLKSLTALPLYLVCFATHQATLKVDDKLMLLHYESSNITFTTHEIFNETNNYIQTDELEMWEKMTLSKDALAVLGWIFVSFGDRQDLLLTYLGSMGKYTENINQSM